MLIFKVNDMSCGHCVGAITKAIKGVDRNAEVNIDLARHLVTVEATEADARALRDAITQAGYSPEPVQRDAPAKPPAKAGGCCGCR